LSPSIRAPGQSSPGNPVGRQERGRRGCRCRTLVRLALVGPRFEGRAERLRAWRREIAVGARRGAASSTPKNGKPLDDARVEVARDSGARAVRHRKRRARAGTPGGPCQSTVPTSERGSNTSPTESSASSVRELPSPDAGGHPDRGRSRPETPPSSAQPDHAPASGSGSSEPGSARSPTSPTSSSASTGSGPPAERSSRPV